MEEALRKQFESGDLPLPNVLEKIIVDQIKRRLPILDEFDRRGLIEQADGTTHEFKVRDSAPVAYFEGEKASTPASKTGYSTKTVSLKIVRAKGGVTGFGEAATRRFINAFEEELQAQIDAISATIFGGMFWGNPSADTYLMDGYDPQIPAANRVHAHDTLSNLGGAPFRGAVGKSKQRGTEIWDRIWVCSSQLTAAFEDIVKGYVRLNVDPNERREFAVGWNVGLLYGYRILECDALQATVQVQNASAAAASGGALADGTYYYRISAITTEGETAASAEVSATADSVAGNSTIDLSWDAVSGAILYRIYRGTASGDLSLLTEISAVTRDADGAVTGNVTSWSDDGTVSPSALGDKPLDVDDHVIFLLPLNRLAASLLRLPDGFGRKVNNLVNYLDLAVTKDAREFLLKGYLTLAVRWPATHVVIRGVKV